MKMTIKADCNTELIAISKMVDALKSYYGLLQVSINTKTEGTDYFTIVTIEKEDY